MHYITIRLLFLSFFATAPAHAVEAKDLLSEILKIDTWHTTVPANGVRLDINDPWSKSRVFGYTFQADSGRLLTPAELSKLRISFSQIQNVHLSQHHPWKPGEVKYFVIINSKGRAIYVISFSADDRSVTRIRQVIQTERGAARKAFGSESLLYLEIADSEFQRIWRQPDEGKRESKGK